MEEVKTMQGSRKVYLDALRILACLAVIYNHVAGGSMRLIDGASGAAALFLFFISKCAVSLFLLISGAVLLGRVDSYKKTGRRILRILAALVLMTLFYYGMNCLQEGEAFQLGAFVGTLLDGTATGSIWYLYLYLAVLVTLPLLQRLSLRMTREDYRWVCGWALLFVAVTPTIASLVPALQINSSFQLVLFSVPLGLMLMGYYMAIHAEPSGKQALTATVSAAVLVAIPTLTTIWRPELFGVWDNYDIPTATGPAVCAFIAGKWLLGQRPLSQRTRNVLAGMGRLTFCTYLIADFLIERLDFIREAMAAALGVNGAGLLYVLLVFIVGMAVAWGLTRVPGLKKIL